MQSINIRYKLNLHWHKIIILLFLAGFSFKAAAQNDVRINLLSYDDQWIHYGFLLGIHSSKYRIQYDEIYSSYDSLHSIVPGNLPGWKVGFVVDMYLWKYMSFRILPTIGFYEQKLTYRYTNDETKDELKDATMVELPLMLKYKSARRGNVAMYMVGGVNPALEASGKGDELDSQERLELKDWNFSIEAGFGFDLYFPLFKFSPEVRYSWGLRNMLTDEGNSFDAALDKLTYQNITFYFTFEGGPTYLTDRNKK